MRVVIYSDYSAMIQKLHHASKVWMYDTVSFRNGCRHKGVSEAAVTSGRVRRCRSTWRRRGRTRGRRRGCVCCSRCCWSSPRCWRLVPSSCGRRRACARRRRRRWRPTVWCRRWAAAACCGCTQIPCSAAAWWGTPRTLGCCRRLEKVLLAVLFSIFAMLVIARNGLPRPISSRALECWVPAEIFVSRLGLLGLRVPKEGVSCRGLALRRSTAKSRPGTQEVQMSRTACLEQLI